jgi:SAM-dependent methyltransferase
VAIPWQRLGGPDGGRETMKSLQDLQKNWEGFAQSDPLWSICADPQKRHNKWDRDEFFATGRREITTVLQHLRGLGLQPGERCPALDFGCGVGRLTRAMAAYFSPCYGVDISPTMIRLAREFNRDLTDCHFLINEQDRLVEFQNHYFGFIYTSIVLQHIGEPYNRSYLRELIRLLRPGGALVFQIPDRHHATASARIRTALALRSRLRRLLHPGKNYVMEMHCMSESAVRALVEEQGARLVDVRLTNSTEPAFSGDLQYPEKEPQWGYVSKQYCVTKLAQD